MYLGLDIGSSSSKVVLLGEVGEILAAQVVNLGTGTKGVHQALEAAYAQAGAGPEGVRYAVVTGYGRMTYQGADKQITEISCHAKGVRHLSPEARTIVDVGGQDTKVIRLNDQGGVENFVMNDKCAAGTGRFYEAMARSFEMTLPEFSNLSLTAKNVIPITAQCTVFAESEVITLVGEGKPMDEIAAGIQMAVAKRCFVMSKKAGATDAITLTGGCAKNAGLKQAIEHVLKLKVIDLKTDPQLMGALGAAEYARQKGMARA